MAAVILVDSWFGNTARLAEAVAEGIGPKTSIVRVGHPCSRSELLRELDVQELDLLVVGGPTISRGMSPDLGETLDAIEGRLHGLDVAAFDSRLHGPGLLMGSAAKHADKRLRAAGAHLLGRPEGFYVRRTAAASSTRPRPEEVTLIPGELDRARQWGIELRDLVHAERVA